MNSYRVKYRSYWGNTIGFSTVEAESSEAAKIKVSSWGFVLECVQVDSNPESASQEECDTCEHLDAIIKDELSKSDKFKIDKSELADNPPSHPGLQDLDIWTEDQMREWIKAHTDMGGFIEGSR